MRIVDRRRHQLGRFAAGIAEHNALVAGALVLVAGGIDARAMSTRLGMQQHLDIGVLPMKAILLVADRLDRLARRVFDRRERNRRAADFAGDHHAIGRRQGLAGDADLIGSIRPWRLL